MAKLPNGVTAWELYEHLVTRMDVTGRAVRRSLILFFAVYMLAELLNAAQIGAISLFGVEIRNIDLLLLLAPVFLAFVAYEQVAVLTQEIVIAAAVSHLPSGMAGGSTIYYIAARPLTITTGGFSVMGEINRASPESRIGQFADKLGSVQLAASLMIPIVQVIALVRVCVLAVQLSAWGWLTVAAVLLIACLAIVFFAVFVAALVSKDDLMYSVRKVTGQSATDESED